MEGRRLAAPPRGMAGRASLRIFEGDLARIDCLALHHGKHARGATSQGYTLLELIVVLLILGAAAAVVAPSLFAGLVRSPLDGAAERAAALLQDARAAAVRSGSPVSVDLSTDGRELRSPTDTLLLEPPLRIEASGSERAVIFYPTGLAAGARWIVRTSEGPGALAAAIEVSLLSGEVVVRRP
ncbi:MAG: type II secretion system protein GspH [Gemmatimonadetes bacterium]|nr:MAG: type II secretion system protein GspH [Gemmatimonadota bacterium]